MASYKRRAAAAEIATAAAAAAAAAQSSAALLKEGEPPTRLPVSSRAPGASVAPVSVAPAPSSIATLSSRQQKVEKEGGSQSLSAGSATDQSFEGSRSKVAQA